MTDKKKLLKLNNKGSAIVTVLIVIIFVSIFTGGSMSLITVFLLIFAVFVFVIYLSFPGIYKTWDECKAQVNGFSGASYKGFATLAEAEEYFQKNCNYPRTWYSHSQNRITGCLYYILKEVWCDDPDDGIDYADVLKYAAAKPEVRD